LLSAQAATTAYVACFGDNYYVPIQMFVKQKVKVERMPVDIMPEAIVLIKYYPIRLTDYLLSPMMWQSELMSNSWFSI